MICVNYKKIIDRDQNQNESSHFFGAHLWPLHSISTVKQVQKPLIGDSWVRSATLIDKNIKVRINFRFITSQTGFVNYIITTTCMLTLLIFFSAKKRKIINTI